MFKLAPILMLGFVSAVINAETMTWLFVHDPPSAIMENDSLVDGFLKPKWTVLTQQLPAYQHTTRTVSLARLQNAMMNGENVCSFLLRSADRERFMWFSHPALVGYSQHIVLTPTAFHALGSPEIIAIAELTQQQLHGVVQKERRYGPHIDPYLDTKPNAIRALVQPQETLLRMMALGRADYTFNYPVFVRYWQNLNPKLNSEFKIVPIKDQAPFKPAYIACSKTAWGKIAIEVINNALTTARRDRAYRFSDDRYLDAKEQQQLTAYYDRYIVEAQ